MGLGLCSLLILTTATTNLDKIGIFLGIGTGTDVFPCFDSFWVGFGVLYFVLYSAALHLLPVLGGFVCTPCAFQAILVRNIAMLLILHTDPYDWGISGQSEQRIPC